MQVGVIGKPRHGATALHLNVAARWPRSPMWVAPCPANVRIELYRLCDAVTLQQQMKAVEINYEHDMATKRLSYDHSEYRR